MSLGKFTPEWGILKTNGIALTLGFMIEYICNGNFLIN